MVVWIIRLPLSRLVGFWGLCRRPTIGPGVFGGGAEQKSGQLEDLIECKTLWLLPFRTGGIHTLPLSTHFKGLMTDHSNDETRLRATETQMRRALGLQSTRARPGDGAPPPGPTGARRLARRFVRDGEVAVSVVARDAAAGTNRWDAAWQALEAQTAAREQAERQLVAAQETIRELQTQLAHARLARNEAVQSAAEEKQASEQVLAAVRAELLTAQASLQRTDQRRPRLPAGPADDPSAAHAESAPCRMTGDRWRASRRPVPPRRSRRHGGGAGRAGWSRPNRSRNWTSWSGGSRAGGSGCADRCLGRGFRARGALTETA